MTGTGAMFLIKRLLLALVFTRCWYALKSSSLACARGPDSGQILDQVWNSPKTSVTKTSIVSRYDSCSFWRHRGSWCVLRTCTGSFLRPPLTRTHATGAELVKVLLDSSTWSKVIAVGEFLGRDPCSSRLLRIGMRHCAQTSHAV